MAWSAGSTLAVLVVLGSGLYLAIERQLRALSEQRLQERVAVMAQRLPLAGSFSVAPIDRLVTQDGTCALRYGPRGPTPGATPVPTAPSATPVAGDCLTTLGVAMGAAPHQSWYLPATVVEDPALPGVLIGGAASGTIALVGSVVPAEDAARSQGFRELDVLGTPMRVLTSTVMVGGRTVGLGVAQDRTIELDTLRATVLVLVGGGAAAVVAAGALGYRYAGRALVPIRDALRRQREFAADASHELRTPLSVIRSDVEALRRTRADPDGRDLVEDIGVEADRMAALVDQLLLLARADSGTQELDTAAVDLGEETAEALAPLARIAHARRVALELDVAPAPMTGDATRLRQLVAILVDNAIRHAPVQGHAWVRVGSAPGHVLLTVEDDGPGVRPEDRRRVFDRFWRAADAPPGGSGLGLAIAAWIVDRHGGSIGVTDRPGGGARFEVRLPAS